MKKFERSSALLGERYEIIEHSSGLRIYVFPKKLTSAYALFAVKYGSIDTVVRAESGEIVELPDGVAHFLEHKLFDNPDGSDSFARFSEYGADANAYTTFNRTAYLFSCTDCFSESLEELLRFVTTPYFTKASVEKEVGIISEEIRMDEDNPWDRSFQRLLELLYETHPVRINVCGSVESIKRITAQTLYDCHRTFYCPSNMALVVCGDVTAEEVLCVADRVLPHEQSLPEPICVRPADLAPVVKPFFEERMQVNKPLFCIGFKDVHYGNTPEERMRRDAVITLLGETLFSRAGKFYNTLFEEGVITASYSFGYSGGDDFAFFDVCGESDDPELVRDRLIEYLASVLRDGIDRDAFERSRRVLYADEIRSYDSTEEIANRLLSFVFDGVEPFEYPEVLQSVTPEEAEAALASLFSKEYMALSVIRPFEDKEKNVIEKEKTK